MYETIIGLEIHAQLKTNTKMFCNSKNDSKEERPNINICPVCMGHPGTLPVINKKAVEHVVKVGEALNCKISTFTKFDRKNYFYPDIPKGYQISQYDLPICENGYLAIGERSIKITRVHLEEDTARSIHGKSGFSFVDFNRAGAPLMELVTEPDIRSAKEARDFAEKLQKILQYLDVSDSNMEDGQMRCEVNVSLRKKAEKEYGTKVEIKNLNSFRAVEDAIAFEIKRQSDILGKGERVIQETRGWDENKKVTFSQRKKESAHDYRYFPEPDLPALKLGVFKDIPSINTIDVDKIKASLPELSQEKSERFQNICGISKQDADVLVADKQTAAFFENVISELRSSINEPENGVCSDKLKLMIKLAANYVNTDLKKLMNENKIEISNIKISEEDFAELIALIYDKKITSAAAKVALEEMFASGGDPDHIIQEKGLLQVSDTAELEKTANEIITANPKAAEDFKAGKQNALQFLVGQMMAKTKGKANPQIARELFENLIK